MPNIILVRAMFDDTKSEVKIKGKEAGSLNDFLPPKGQINKFNLFEFKRVEFGAQDNIRFELCCIWKSLKRASSCRLNIDIII